MCPRKYPNSLNYIGLINGS